MAHTRFNAFNEKADNDHPALINRQNNLPLWPAPEAASGSDRLWRWRTPRLSATSSAIEEGYNVSASQIGDIVITLLPQSEPVTLIPYSVMTDTRRPGEYVLRFGAMQNVVLETYTDLAAALIRADDIRRGIPSAQWIFSARIASPMAAE